VGVRQAARAAFVVVAWLFVACSIIQVFLAGLGVFAGAQNFATHRDFGYLFGLLTIVLIALALVGRMPRRFVGLTVLLLVLFALQSVFIVAWRSGAPAVAALHPVNALLIVGLSAMLARRGRALAPPPIGTAPAERAADRVPADAHS
jgi:hypothetical protein